MVVTGGVEKAEAARAAEAMVAEAMVVARAMVVAGRVVVGRVAVMREGGRRDGGLRGSRQEARTATLTTGLSIGSPEPAPRGAWRHTSTCHSCLLVC